MHHHVLRLSIVALFVLSGPVSIAFAQQQIEGTDVEDKGEKVANSSDVKAAKP